MAGRATTRLTPFFVSRLILCQPLPSIGSSVISTQPRQVPPVSSTPQRITASMSSKRTAADISTAAAKKSKTNTAEIPKFDKNLVDAAGFCTHPSLQLSAKEIEVVTRGGNGNDIHGIYTEKELVGKGTKELHWICDGTSSSPRKLVFYYDKKKCTKPDRLRIEAMVDAARKAKKENKSAQAYVLLKVDSGICKRNTLPELVSGGYVVQRAE